MHARTQALSRPAETFRINIHGRFINKEIARRHGSVRKFERNYSYDRRPRVRFSSIRGRKEIHVANVVEAAIKSRYVFAWLAIVYHYQSVKVSYLLFKLSYLVSFEEGKSLSVV